MRYNFNLQKYSIYINISQFKRPEFVASAEVVSKDPHRYSVNLNTWCNYDCDDRVEGEALIKVKASYYSGGALPDSQVDWNVTSGVGVWKEINNIHYVANHSYRCLRTPWRISV